MGHAAMSMGTRKLTWAYRNETRPPNADLASDTIAVHSLVEGLVNAGRVVVALAHSYGGQVASNALYGLGLQARSDQGLPGGVSRIIYMAAFAVKEGTSMIDVVKAHGHESLIPIAFLFDEDQSVVSADPKTLIVGEGADPTELESYVGTFVRWNGKCMYQPIDKCAWKQIPVSYVYTARDMTVPLEYQKDMVADLEAAGRQVQTFELETGHCPNLTMTEGLVDAVNKAVAA